MEDTDKERGGREGSQMWGRLSGQRSCSPGTEAWSKYRRQPVASPELLTRLVQSWLQVRFLPCTGAALKASENPPTSKHLTILK